mmetsp:Transcript_499/g.1100  ORF Transcript_499/g.1100 Transcript_499/m.1100 type:complete len:200 (+) Transcript_499:510-1109(+)
MPLQKTYATTIVRTGSVVREKTHPYWKALKVVKPAARACVIRTTSNAWLPAVRVLPKYCPKGLESGLMSDRAPPPRGNKTRRRIPKKVKSIQNKSRKKKQKVLRLDTVRDGTLGQDGWYIMPASEVSLASKDPNSKIACRPPNPTPAASPQAASLRVNRFLDACTLASWSSSLRLPPLFCRLSSSNFSMEASMTLSTLW